MGFTMFNWTKGLSVYGLQFNYQTDRHFLTLTYFKRGRFLTQHENII